MAGLFVVVWARDTWRVTAFDRPQATRYSKNGGILHGIHFLRSTV
jgi:hypothetical protein